MTDIHVGCHAPDRDTFVASMVKYGLGVMEDGEFIPHRELRISEEFTPVRPTGEVDKDGFPISEPIPGYHCNLWAIGKLAEALIHHPITGEVYPQKSDNSMKDVTERTRMKDVATSGKFVERGVRGNEKLPRGFESDNCRFFDLKHLSTPANVWA